MLDPWAAIRAQPGTVLQQPQKERARGKPERFIQAMPGVGPGGRASW